MTIKEGNCAYIDGANLHQGIKSLGWKLDYERFRVWLREKHSVTNACLFLGYIPKFIDLYRDFEKAGYTLIFKEVVKGADGVIKGNCDADLVFEAVKGYYEDNYNKAIIVSSDGDYARLIQFLRGNNRLKVLLSPHATCSSLIRKLSVPLTYMRDLKEVIEAKKKKPPLETEH